MLLAYFETAIVNANTTQDTQVFVVDDDQAVLKSIEHALRSANIEVATFANAQDCLENCDLSRPLCLIVDLLMPGMTGIKLCEQLSAIHECFAFVMITGYAEVHSAVLAMKLGAIDFFEKPVGRERLLDAVNQAISGVEKRKIQSEYETLAAARFSSLTPREQEVFVCAADGLVSKQIARRLGISPKTVDVHRSNIMRKLCLDSPSQFGSLIAVLRRGQANSSNKGYNLPDTLQDSSRTRSVPESSG